MRPEDAACKYQFREGFELVDYAPVGIPIFRLLAEAVTAIQRPVPPIQLFVMKCISIGISTDADIAAFLGLSGDAVHGATQLLRANHATQSQVQDSEGRSNYRLTPYGQRLLEAESEHQPQEEMILFDFDGIRRIPIWLGNESVLTPMDIAASGGIQIRPYPARPPEIQELRLSDVGKVIRRQAAAESTRDILAINSFVRRRNVFREGVALIFQSRKTEQVQVGFVVGGQLSTDYEVQFAEHGGPHKMGIARQMNLNQMWERIEQEFGSGLISQLAPDTVLTPIRQAMSKLIEFGLASWHARAESAEDRSGEATETVTEAQKKLESTRSKLNGLGAYALAPYELEGLLWDAVQTAKSRLTITSSGLSRLTVNTIFLNHLDILLGRGVEVDITTKYAPNAVGGKREDQFDPLRALSERLSRFRNLRMKTEAPKDFFFLFKDDEVAVISSKPFLGEPTPRRTRFTCTVGVVAHDIDAISGIRRVAGSQE